MFQGTLFFCTTLINDHQILAEATVLHVIYMLTTSIFTPFFVYSPQYAISFKKPNESLSFNMFQPLVLGIQFGSQKNVAKPPRLGSRSTGQPEQQKTAPRVKAWGKPYGNKIAICGAGMGWHGLREP